MNENKNTELNKNTNINNNENSSKTKTKKFGFFQRLKTAIFKLEDYGLFLGEKFTESFKFLVLLILLTTLILAGVGTFNFSRMLTKGREYYVNELPEFEYKEGKLHSQNNVEAYDHDYKFRLFINTDDNVSNEQIQEYFNKAYKDDTTLIFLQDKAIYSMAGERLEQSYLDDSMTQEMKDLEYNKQSLLEQYDALGQGNLLSAYFVINFVSVFVNNFLLAFGYVAIVALFGYIAARFCGVRFKMTPMMTLSVYALTLSNVLSCLYYSILMLTGFYIKYFDVMYMLIAYVYIIAAILMIKYDLIKQNMELQKIIEVQKDIKEEMDKDTEENKEKEKKEDSKEDDKKEEKTEEDNTPVVEENREPDGSEI